MKPEDFKNKEPRLVIEEYMTGNVKAWGVLQNRSGKVIRQFSADLNGTWDGTQLILKEKFNWDDGEVQDREWIINKIDLIDAGTSDQFYDLLGTAAIASVVAEQKAAAIVRLQDGYDHSYFFVSTFMPDHIEFHANALLGKSA